MKLLRKGEFSLLLQIILWSIVLITAFFLIKTYIVGGAASVPGEGLLTP